MSSKLELVGLTKLFDNGTPEKKRALDGLELTVEPGQFVTVLGSNGAGKSTMFHAILGTFLTDEGRIVLGGEDITFMPRHKRAASIGCMYQDPMRGTAPNMTIAENLALAFTRQASRSFFAVNRRDRAFFREHLAELDMGLEERLDAKMGQLSGGQRQAAALLMATLAKPKLLLLDEHTAALDPAAAGKVLELTRTIVRRDGVTTLMITHDMSQALECGDRTIMMDAGRVVLDVQGEERGRLTPAALADMFRSRGGALDDRTLLAQGTRQEKV